MKMGERAWEDFVVGESYRTESVTIGETHVVNWASLTGDWVPLHMDAEYAKTTVFGQRVAHGPLTLSMALGLGTRTGIFGNCVVAWIGLDEVRLPRPVCFGDTITVEIGVESTRPTSRSGRGLVTLAYSVVNQADDAVMTFRSSFILAMRSPVEISA